MGRICETISFKNYKIEVMIYSLCLYNIKLIKFNNLTGKMMKSLFGKPKEGSDCLVSNAHFQNVNFCLSSSILDRCGGKTSGSGPLVQLKLLYVYALTTANDNYTPIEDLYEIALRIARKTMTG